MYIAYRIDSVVNPVEVPACLTSECQEQEEDGLRLNTLGCHDHLTDPMSGTGRICTLMHFRS